MEVGVTISPTLLLQNELFTFVVTSCYATIFMLHFCKCYIVKVLLFDRIVPFSFYIAHVVLF